MGGQNGIRTYEIASKKSEPYLPDFTIRAQKNQRKTVGATGLGLRDKGEDNRGVPAPRFQDHERPIEHEHPIEEDKDVSDLWTATPVLISFTASSAR